MLNSCTPGCWGTLGAPRIMRQGGWKDPLIMDTVIKEGVNPLINGPQVKQLYIK